MKDLVKIIKENPNCIAVIDSDYWRLYPARPKKEEDMTEKEFEVWLNSELACDSDIEPLGDGGYGSGNCDGGDILQALARIVGVNVESV